VIAYGDSFLRSKAFVENHQPEWIVNFGGPPLSKTVLSWLQASPATDYFVVDPFVRWPDPVLRVTHLLRSNPVSVCLGLKTRVKPAPAGWAESFAVCERQIDVISRSESGGQFWEAPILRRLLDAAPDDSIVFSGNSMSVRDFDSFSGKVDKNIRLIANRGTNGIDGHVAVLLGIQAGQNKTTMAMVGDCSFAHDIGSLQLARDHHDVILVVLNNGGGAIFEYLPTAKTPEFNDYLVPPTADIGGVARACGWSHWRVDSIADFEAVLAKARLGSGPRLIEAVIDRQVSVRQHNTIWSIAARLSGPPRLTKPDDAPWTQGYAKMDADG
jgi:2-succinyl-5-enolpyruvyl-6-hydroxy-3-cyclohexene-1-carboxylate synthase